MATALLPTDDPAKAIAELAACKKPWLFGVRHHSPACSAALGPLLDAYKPTVVAIEMPADLGAWLPWLGHPEAKAPLAVAAVAATGEDLGFYPFADFSPELVAIRWAHAHDVPVHAIDLPAASRAGHGRDHGAVIGIAERLQGEDSWEHLVEGPGTLGEPERVRRAALLYGWALRLDAARGEGVAAVNRAREQYMRAALAKLQTKTARVAAIIGSFHAAALLPEPTLWSAPAPREGTDAELVSSLIPYGFELLDARSGYPAGIRDPRWQQRLFECEQNHGDVTTLVAESLVEITRGIRARGLPASMADAHAATEVAFSLARMRQLAAPGRRELLEAVQTALAQGELLGRGRIVAKALEHVMVGTQRGQLATGTPRSGLGPHVHALLAELRLPATQTAEYEDLRLDPLRSAIDRRRYVALARLRACGVPYGEQLESSGAGGVESLTSVWRVKMTPSTEAMIELAGLRGVTLRQAAAGSLRADRRRLEEGGKLTPAAQVALVESAADAGLGELVTEWLGELAGPRLPEATLADLIGLIALWDRIAAGHSVGLPADPADAVSGEIDHFTPPAIDRIALLNAAVASVLGLAGSEALADARALAELVRVLERPEHAGLGDSRLRWSIDELARTGTPVMAAAAEVVRVSIESQTAEQLSDAIGGWVDAAIDNDSRKHLAAKLRGAITVAGPLFEAAPQFLEGLMARVERLEDGAFLERVAALRDGFDVLSNASRRRLLVALGARLGIDDARGQGLDVITSLPPEQLALAADADRAGRAAIEMFARPDLIATSIAAAVPTMPRTFGHDISLRDRWRMILGHEREQMKPRAARATRALDELYGHGHGEGSRGDLGMGGGQEQAFPTVRAWKDEIEALFGSRVFEEVAAKAATAGRIGALLEVDPGQVTPSVELLEQVLSLKGGLGEAALGRLRALIKHIVDDLVKELATRIRPALQGALGTRATRRPTSTLHLRKTVAANLARARVDAEGDVSLVPETLYFKQRSRRHMDWNVVLVVDVSGSMEPSVIYSAMMAAILSGVPWVSVKFLAFSTEVVDLTEHVSDPLALLLEVSIGGGTYIAKALRYARGLVEVPQRTIVIVVSDFEEGYAVETLVSEVRSLVEAGVTCLGLAALDDRGAPRYEVRIAEQVAAAGMPVAALTPLELARWVGDKNPMTRPAIDPGVAAQLTAQIPARLVKKLDAEPTLAEKWTWTADAVTTDKGETVKLEVVGGVVHGVACTCLLSPKCLHVAAVIALLEPAEAQVVVEEVVEAGENVAASIDTNVATNAYRVCATVLATGAESSGAFGQAELLRSIHACRDAGLYRLAQTLTRVLRSIRDLRADKPTFILSALAADLRDATAVAYQLAHGVTSPALVGFARRDYEAIGNLRLHGIFSEALVARTGYAGTITYLADDRGRLFTRSDVNTGDAGRAAAAYEASANIGDAVLSHRDLSRAGLFVGDATASTDGRLGAGQKVKAVRAKDPSTWAALDTRFATPLAVQLSTIAQSESLAEDQRPGGWDLVFLEGAVIGLGNVALLDLGGHALELATSLDHRALTARDNLVTLGKSTGLRVRVIGRVRLAQPRRLELLALAPAADETRLVLADDLHGRANFHYDRLSTPSGTAAAKSLSTFAAPPPDLLEPLRRRIERVVQGGAATLPTHALPELERDAAQLAERALRTGADMLRDLGAATQSRRTLDRERFAIAWLRAAVYDDAARRRTSIASW